MKPLQENPSHLKSKNLVSGAMEELGYHTHQEFNFTIVNFFGYSPQGLWRIVRDIQFLRGQRFIGKSMDVSTYVHNIDVYAEKMTDFGRRKIALEIDGESHDPTDIEQMRNDAIFETMFMIWMEQPRDIFRIRKEHVLGMPLNLMTKFMKFVIRGKYTELLSKEKDHTIDIALLIPIVEVS